MFACDHLYNYLQVIVFLQILQHPTPQVVITIYPGGDKEMGIPCSIH